MDWCEIMGAGTTGEVGGQTPHYFAVGGQTHTESVGVGSPVLVPKTMELILERATTDTPWGFALQGTTDEPKVISQIRPATPAEGILLKGDVVINIQLYHPTSANTRTGPTQWGRVWTVQTLSLNETQTRMKVEGVTKMRLTIQPVEQSAIQLAAPRAYPIQAQAQLHAYAADAALWSRQSMRVQTPLVLGRKTITLILERATTDTPWGFALQGTTDEPKVISQIRPATPGEGTLLKGDVVINIQLYHPTSANTRTGPTQWGRVWTVQTLSPYEMHTRMKVDGVTKMRLTIQRVEQSAIQLAAPLAYPTQAQVHAQAGRVCRACEGGNDADFTFCKHCGSKDAATDDAVAPYMDAQARSAVLDSALPPAYAEVQATIKKDSPRRYAQNSFV